MMRDSQTLPEQLSINQHDADMYAALWASAPFPQVPEDAPIEIKRLTVDIDDPRKVYTIHKATRRHEFQVLVERFITQIRYGCQSPKCHTKTCFSHRKRLAGGAPVRRYNATSARTLAIYLASQDNPEQALCSNPKTADDLRRRVIVTKPPVTSRNVTISANTRQDNVAADGQDDGIKKPIKICKSSNMENSSNLTTLLGNATVENPHISDTGENSFRPSDLEESIKVDHKSFAQAMFGTAAFKMVEWLAPRHMMRLSNISQKALLQPDESPSIGACTEAKEPMPSRSNHASLIKDKEDDRSTKAAIGLSGATRGATGEAPCVHSREPSPATSSPQNTTTKVKPSFNSSHEDKPVLKRKNSHVRTSSETLEHHPSRSIINHPLKAADTESHHFSQLKPPRQAIVRQTLVSSSSLRRPEHVIPSAIPQQNSSIESETSDLPVLKIDKVKPDQGIHKTIPAVPKPSHTKPQGTQTKARSKNPQSLSHLPAEIILMLSDILTINDISQDHDLYPSKILDEVEIEQAQSKLVLNSSGIRNSDKMSTPSRSMWLSFVEQSIFSVFSQPDLLLQSFRREDLPMDNMTIWYLMLRLTRIAPSVVFDSLWRVSESLFKPPNVLTSTYDWEKSTKSELENRKPLSNEEAAQVISICMHALIAAAPLVQDSRQLMNMSRIRSNGLAVPGRESVSPKSAAIFVRYNDAFANENALRLARRLFAAIPNRRSYTEQLRSHMNLKDTTCPQEDILDLVLDSLRPSIGTLPVIGFSGKEVNIHETRTITLVLDWARTVMMQGWTGTAEVPAHGAFGGALMTISAIHRNRNSFLLGDIHFQTQYFSDRLDLISTAREWSSFEQNKRTVHLLDHPYLFHPEILVSYFRAINYARMNQAYETAKSSSGMMSTAISHQSLMVDRSRRQRLEDQMRTANSLSLVLEVRRTHVLLDAFNSLWRREERELLRPIKLRLGEDSGEEGMDLGGVQQEFFGLAVAEALDPNYGTFTIDGRTRMTWFQPGSPEPLWKFELIGTIISLAVYNGLTLPITFPKALYRRLLGEEVTELHHIQDGWPELAAGLTTLLEWDEADGAVEDVFARTYEFSISLFGQHISRDMSTSDSWPQFSPLSNLTNPDDAPLVTNDNRNQFISDYIRWLTDISIAPQFEAFKRGFFTCLTPRSITLFDAATLQSLIEGEQTIDISELRRAARYQGWDSTHQTVRDFWSIAKKFDIEQKRKLLEFVTASDRVPVGGMRNMQFTLQKNGQDDIHLPTSATCFGILLLPEYSSKEILREKLMTALENSKGFGAM